MMWGVSRFCGNQSCRLCYPNGAQQSQVASQPQVARYGPGPGAYQPPAQRRQNRDSKPQQTSPADAAEIQRLLASRRAALAQASAKEAVRVKPTRPTPKKAEQPSVQNGTLAKPKVAKVPAVNIQVSKTKNYYASGEVQRAKPTSNSTAFPLWFAENQDNDSDVEVQKIEKVKTDRVKCTTKRTVQKAVVDKVHNPKTSVDGDNDDSAQAKQKSQVDKVEKPETNVDSGDDASTQASERLQPIVLLFDEAEAKHLRKVEKKLREIENLEKISDRPLTETEVKKLAQKKDLLADEILSKKFAGYKI